MFDRGNVVAGWLTNREPNCTNEKFNKFDCSKQPAYYFYRQSGVSNSALDHKKTNLFACIDRQLSLFGGKQLILKRIDLEYSNAGNHFVFSSPSIGCLGHLSTSV